jgi:hypothetical protein
MRNTLLSLFSGDWLKSIISIALGWLLSQLSQYSLERRDRRKAISRALSDLLEIRHQFLSIETAVGEIERLAKLTPEAKAQFYTLVNNALPNWQYMGQRYDESVSLIASIDPLLAFELRSKDQVRPTLSMLQNIASQDPQAAAFWNSFHKKIVSQLEPDFDAAVRKLAWKRGSITRLRVEKKLKKRRELPATAEQMLTMIREQMEQEKAAHSAQEHS